MCPIDNAIPIKSWFSDPSDTALLNLLPMLDALRWGGWGGQWGAEVGLRGSWRHLWGWGGGV